ncbi:hypothetical protein AB0G06_43505 [Nonomuraea dietziae]|uniref:hypothetical protein n=1 Tax=Nonomuraea dietziae TaxID=65515 RepID=UPI0033D501F0
MTLEDLEATYGRVWEFHPKLAVGVAAIRRRTPSPKELERGVVEALVAPNLAGLVPALEKQRRLCPTDFTPVRGR